MDYTCKETIVNNMKDFGCDELTIHKFLECFDACDKNGQKKILESCRQKLLDSIHQSQKKIDILDYMVYQLEKCNCCETEKRGNHVLF